MRRFPADGVTVRIFTMALLHLPGSREPASGYAVDRLPNTAGPCYVLQALIISATGRTFAQITFSVTKQIGA